MALHIHSIQEKDQGEGHLHVCHRSFFALVYDGPDQLLQYHVKE